MKTDFKEYLVDLQTKSRKYIEEYCDKIKNSPLPLFELEWSANLFTASADHNAATHCLTLMDKDAEIKDVMDFLREEVLRMSRYIPNSTSQAANLTASFKLAAYSQLFDNLKYYNKK